MFWGSPPPRFGPPDAWFGKDIGHDLHKTLLPNEPMKKRWSIQEPTYPLEKRKMLHETWPWGKQ